MLIVTPERIGPAKRTAGFSIKDYWVWCPSLIKDSAGLYHLFASRWPKTLPMHPGWLLESEVVRATSKNAEGPFEFAQVVLPERGAAWWDGRATHNPRVISHSGKYYLFYMGATHPFSDWNHQDKLEMSDPRVIVSRSNKRIGVAVADHPSGPWKRPDVPLFAPRPDFFDSYFSSNPAPVFHPDGSVTMIYKSRSYLKKDKGYAHGPMELGLARAKNVLGPYERFPEPIFGPGRFAEVEDPFLWLEGETFHLLAKDMGSSLTGEYHAGVHFISKDALRWELHPSPKIYSRDMTWDDGTKQTLGSLERASIYFEEGEPKLLWGAVADGPGGFSSASRTWDLVFPIEF
jgi:hypothetical protein